jgi:hypothetical protein
VSRTAGGRSHDGRDDCNQQQRGDHSPSHPLPSFSVSLVDSGSILQRCWIS